MYAQPRFLAAGETGLVVEFSDRVEEAANEAVHFLDAHVRRWLSDPRARGLDGSVPTYRSLLLRFDPGLLPRGRLEGMVRQALAGAVEGVEGAGGGHKPCSRHLSLPVCYEGEYAPDLQEVAAMTGLSNREVVRLHTGTEYLVHMMGFQIGYPYMASLVPQLRLPRLARPRLKTPCGAVAIAEELTGVYSLPSPGGWRVIGNTPVRMWDLDWDPPSLLRAGDRVSFYAIGPDEHRAMEQSGWVPPEARVTPRAGAGDAGRSSVQPVLGVERPGPLATVQDLGRSGYERYGCGPGGAMDRFALRVGNRLLGNPEGAAAVEVTAGGAEFAFLSSGAAVWTGGTGDLRLDEKQVPGWTVFAFRPGQRLVVGILRHGFRGYLCIGGGVAVRPVLGSRSTNLGAGFGGHYGRKLQTGDMLPASPMGPEARTMSTRVADPEVVREVYLRMGVGPPTLRVVPGPQDGRFGPEARDALYGPVFRVGNESNRMGYRLAGPEVRPTGGADIVSDGAVAGAIQVPGNGQPVLLMADHQTTGGYAKAGVVVTADLPPAAQLRPGDELAFAPVEVAEASKLHVSFEQLIARAAGDLVQMRLGMEGRIWQVTVDMRR
ncbi:MAG: 5-oxoprolinase subunit PxpB [Bacillota bacterium]|nr:5-oxoprolinase subunit PxpB [Bacillota bacterium]